MISNDEKVTVADAMSKYGGGFVQALGQALYHADHNNTQRIKDTWPELWKQYLEMGGK